MGWCTEPIHDYNAHPIHDYNAHPIHDDNAHPIHDDNAHPIHDDNAHVGKTLPVWPGRILTVLRDYASTNQIARTFGAFSREYGKMVPNQLAEEGWRAVPIYEELGSVGSAMRVVPQRVAHLVIQFLKGR